jgi:hypothetical protein
VKSETNSLYIQGIEELKTQGFEVLAIVCDGRKGFFVKKRENLYFSIWK